MSSVGAYGFTPWIDRTSGHWGVLAMQVSSRLRRVAEANHASESAPLALSTIDRGSALRNHQNRQRSVPCGGGGSQGPRRCGLSQALD